MHYFCATNSNTWQKLKGGIFILARSFRGIQSIRVTRQKSSISQDNNSMFTGRSMGNRKQAATRSGRDLRRPTHNDLLLSFKGSTAFKLVPPQTGEQGPRIWACGGIPESNCNNSLSLVSSLLLSFWGGVSPCSLVGAGARSLHQTSLTPVKIRLSRFTECWGKVLVSTTMPSYHLWWQRKSVS